MECPRVVVQPVHGLANRLRGIASGQALARHFGLGFAMFWGPGEGYSDDAWNDLFANRIHQLSAQEYESALRGGSPVFSDWLERVPGTGLRPRAGFNARRVLPAIRDRGLIYDVGYQDLDEQLPQHGVRGLRRVRAERRRCFREFRPAEPIARVVDEYVARLFAGREVVGVHIRRGDAVAGPLAERYWVSSDEAFVRVIESELESGAASHIFLATDCEKTEASFAERFGSQLMLFEKPFVESIVDAPKEGLHDAVTELYLLSRTRRLIGNNGSTFGRIAARIGGIQFDVAR